jgi:hypothetical protein
MNLLPFFFFGGMLVIFVLAIVFSIFSEKKRCQEMIALAGQLGLEFAAKGSPAIPHLDQFALFGRGSNRTFYNTMRGSVEGVRVAVFDYRFTTGSGKNRTTHQQTVCGIFDEQLDLPRFELKPEGFFSKLGALFGYQDIDFPENTEFSRKYVLRGESEEQIRAAFTPDVLAFFETRPGLYVEGGGDTIIFFKAGQRLKTVEIQGFLMEGIRGLVVFRKGRE